MSTNRSSLISCGVHRCVAATIALRLIVGLLVALSVCQVHAQSHSPLYWHATATSSWNTAANWWTAPSGTLSSTSPGVANDAVFNGLGVNGSTTAQLNAAASVVGLYFTNTGATLVESNSPASEPLSIGADGINIAATAGPVTLGNATEPLPISITGSESWSDNSTAVDGLTVVNGISESTTSTLGLTGSGNTAITGVVSNGTGTLSLMVSGSGTVAFAAANTYTGTTTIGAGGTALLQASSVLSNGTLLSGPLGTGTAILGSNDSGNASLRFGVSSGLTVANPIIISSGSSGIVTIGGQNTSGIDSLSGNVTLGSTSNTGKSLNLSVAGGGELDVAGNILANGRDATAGINVTNWSGVGTATVLLAGNNTFGGGTTVGAGTK